MSDTKQDGGPAFPMPAGPEPRVNEATHYNEGMSLRDYFAGQTLVALIEAYAKKGISEPEAVSERAYLYADAMLKAREK